MAAARILTNFLRMHNGYTSNKKCSGSLRSMKNIMIKQKLESDEKTLNEKPKAKIGPGRSVHSVLKDFIEMDNEFIHQDLKEHLVVKGTYEFIVNPSTTTCPQEIREAINRGIQVVVTFPLTEKQLNAFREQGKMIDFDNAKVIGHHAVVLLFH